MDRRHDNPDRDFSADAKGESQQLRDLLKTSAVTDYFDDVARMRIGNLISRAVFDPDKRWW